MSTDGLGLLPLRLGELHSVHPGTAGAELVPPATQGLLICTPSDEASEVQGPISPGFESTPLRCSPHAADK